MQNYKNVPIKFVSGPGSYPHGLVNWVYIDPGQYTMPCEYDPGEYFLDDQIKKS